MKGREQKLWSYMTSTNNIHVRLQAAEIASETLVERLIHTNMSAFFFAFEIDVCAAHTS